MFWDQQSQDSNKKITNDDGSEISKSWLLDNMSAYFSKKLFRLLPSNWLHKYSIIPEQDIDRKIYGSIMENWVNNQKFNIQDLALKQDELRVLSTILGLSIGDSLGASTQFQSFEKKRKPWIQNDFKDLQQCIKKGILSERHGQIGIWTDDCSMALAMSDSILLNKYQFNPKNIRYMFTLWLRHGLGNGGRSHSIGLGGNISMSMSQFLHQQQEYTKQGNQLTSGNGSLMRLAPIPLAFRDEQEKAIQFSGKSSLTTHQGQQAQQCCKLMGLIIVRLVNRVNKQNWRQVLMKACNDYVDKSKAQSVIALAKSQQQSEQLYKLSCQRWKSFKENNRSIQDRNWNWKSPQFTYSTFRADRQPGYIGSYCMDALSMALHIVWNTQSFKQAVLWAINMGGDCDTVGAIVGQIAGAAHGFNQQVFHLYSQMQDFTSKRYEIFLKGIKISKKRRFFETEAIQGVGIKPEKVEKKSTNQSQCKSNPKIQTKVIKKGSKK